MSIMSAYAESDDRGTAWLLADTARRCLSDAVLASESGYSLNNTYRLLETYRHNRSSIDRQISRQKAAGTSELFPSMPSDEQHLVEIKEALDGALIAVFGGDEISQAVDRIEEVLRSTAYPEKFKLHNMPDRELVVKFFDELVNRLQIR